METLTTPNFQENRILIVDDNITNLRIVSDKLERYGFQIILAEDGKTALMRARDSRPDIILLDVVMPGMDGFETCRRLKADNATKDIPVIFMTALTQTEYKIKGFQVGGVDYITKPFQEEELLARVITHLRLRELTEQLEQKVKERTNELSTANQHLKQEIAERKRAEEEMRHLRNLLCNIVNSMPSVLIGVNLSGNVTQWNREAENITGVTADTAQGSLLTDVFPQLADEMVRVRQAICERKPQKDEKVAQESDGKIHYLDVTVYPLLANGVEGAVIRVDDVTERVHMEEMMIQTEKMMTVSGLAAGMAHEINNPLGIILQGIQNTIRRLSLQIDRNKQVAGEIGVDLEHIRTYLEQRNILQYLEGMQEAATRASRIIANMLSFSHRSQLDMAPANINQLLDDTLELASKDYDLKKKYDFRHIEIIRDYDTTLPNIFCTSTEMSQVFLNLLRNAAQAIIDKKAEAYTPQIRITTRKEREYAMIEIEDNGPGMDEESQKRIFEPFYTTKSVGVGTGLGLSVSYFIVASHHKGTITVESFPGQGAKFIIRLPLTSD